MDKPSRWGAVPIDERYKWTAAELPELLTDAANYAAIGDGKVTLSGTDYEAEWRGEAGGLPIRLGLGGIANAAECQVKVKISFVSYCVLTLDPPAGDSDPTWGKSEWVEVAPRVAMHEDAVQVRRAFLALPEELRLALTSGMVRHNIKNVMLEEDDGSITTVASQEVQELWDPMLSLAAQLRFTALVGAYFNNLEET